jgi:cbb3-type cytochrome oxidase subunit 3
MFVFMIAMIILVVAVIAFMYYNGKNKDKGNNPSADRTSA